MKHLIFILLLMSTSIAGSAQQDLKDPRYIYSLDDKNTRARSIAYNLSDRPGQAVLYNGRLYKGVDLLAFCYDSSLVYHDIRTCWGRRSIKRHTKERGIKTLYVVGEYNPGKKFVRDNPEYQRYFR